MVEVRPWLGGDTPSQGRYARALGGPQSPPVGGDRQAFRGGQRSTLRLKNFQKAVVQTEVIGSVAGEALCAHRCLFFIPKLSQTPC